MDSALRNAGGNSKSNDAKVLCLTCCGNAVLTYDGRQIPVVNRKSLALLAYLASTTHGSETRERLAGLLWSESTEEKARASLRQTVGDLKDRLSICDPAPFTADRLNIRLNLALATTDLHRVRSGLAEGQIDPILLERKRIFEDYLAGFEDIDPGFRSWLMVQRQCLQDEVVRRLEDMISATPDLLLLKRVGLALLNVDPTNERGCRAAMEATARLGDTAGALRLYKTLWDVLDEEFDAEPSQKTQDLVLEIKMGRIGPPYALQPGGSDGALNADSPGQGLFLFVGDFATEGAAIAARSSIRIFRHELIAALVRFRDWAVLDLAGTTVPDARRPAFLIEATVFDDGNALRFVLTLKDTLTKRFIWSEHFAIEASAWYRTQQRMIRRIAVALDVSMSSERLMQVSGIPDLSLDQFDKWLKAQELIFRWRPQDDAKAEALFRSIISTAPRFAPAYSGLAGILNSRHLIFPGLFRDAAHHAEALSLAKTAVQIDPIDSRTQLHLGWSFAMNGLWEKASLHFLLACELNSNDPWSLVSASLGLAYCNDRDSADRLSRLALDVGLGVSKLHWSYQAGVRFVLGDFSGCIEAASQAEDVVFYLGAWKAAAHALAGETEAAREEARKFVALVRTNWFGKQQPDDAKIVEWLLHCFPIVEPRVLDNLRRGLTKAGLPTASPSRRQIAIVTSSAAAADRIVGDA